MSTSEIHNLHGQFHPHPPKSEHLESPKHKPGAKASPNDNAPEYAAETFAPGTAPPDRTFQPNPIEQVPGQALNENVERAHGKESVKTTASSTITGATSADVNRGLGRPMQGESSVEHRHGDQKHGKHHGSGLEGVGANEVRVEDDLKRLEREDNVPKGSKAAERGVPAEERPPETASSVSADVNQHHHHHHQQPHHMKRFSADRRPLERRENAVEGESSFGRLVAMGIRACIPQMCLRRQRDELIPQLPARTVASLPSLPHPRSVCHSSSSGAAVLLLDHFVLLGCFILLRHKLWPTGHANRLAIRRCNGFGMPGGMRRMSRGASASPLAGKTAAVGADPMSLIRTFNSETNPSRPIHPSPLTASQIRGMPLDLIDRLRSFPLFQSTPESFLAEIGLRLRPQLNSPNDYILTEGDEAKAMYWLVRGAVAVTSRDGESVYAELKPGAFFGEIGILMDRPRTATIIARTRCLLVVLTKEDLQGILPRFPEVERAIREEAEERLQILEKKKTQAAPLPMRPERLAGERRGSKRLRDAFSGDMSLDDERRFDIISKKRKSPSPSIAETSTSSALANGLVSVRMLLKELPLFSQLPPDILHFLGLNAQPRTFPPFTDIIRQDSYGREIYFIVRGEVEVINERPDPRATRRGADAESLRSVEVKARLRQGQYFGEVVSLSLAPRRTATVRSVSAVECLMISGEVLSEFWERCPKNIKEQVENTAKKRLEAASGGDVVMEDAPPAGAFDPCEPAMPTTRRQSMPLLTFTESDLDSFHKPNHLEDAPVLRPSDPDPYLSVDLDNMRARSRRGSLAPIVPDDAISADQSSQVPALNRSPRSLSPSKQVQAFPTSSVSSLKPVFRPSFGNSRGIFNDDILITILQHMELHHLLRLRSVSRHWSNLITKSPHLLHFLDLSIYNRKITDEVITDFICPFIGGRPRVVDINNCFHITDEGFNALANSCGTNLRALRMKSVGMSRLRRSLIWQTRPRIYRRLISVIVERKLCLADCTYLTDNAIVYLTNAAKALQELDLSFCCALSDTATEVIALGCPQLTYLNLSFCGSAVSDASLRSIGLHLPLLHELSVRGCVRVTGTGVESVVENCPMLGVFDVSQCKNLTPWLEFGCHRKYSDRIRFVTVAHTERLLR
ncbi:conserved hypothetical protein [Uncinocarpus reesii 1704]|uniref:Cyclic nucleotide-binding domain-containing protein n=1 Tax=Uncinocarpus reesii (strain UAMH 1704) TaxID=336963 RepID=C4JJF0_UNCRE|nr:uncharacterized protein UREG_01757 [Uncinocarpus reesii 1704]EEP76908.1 conserved hypothetical protein [Uncinocarpus reesii 1704]